MNKITYNIKYKICFTDGTILVNKEINIKNCDTDIQAQIKLEKYLCRKYDNFGKLVVYECKKDPMSAFNGMFGGMDNPFAAKSDAFSAFGDIFNKTN